MDTLSDRQLAQAWNIAQYDVQAAARYCKLIDAKNQMKCPVCYSALIKAGSSSRTVTYCCPHRCFK